MIAAHVKRAFLLAILSLSSCSTLPKFQTVLSPQKIGPHVSDIVNEVQCEILQSVKDSEIKGSSFSGLQSGDYVANVDLTLQVTDNQSFDPALNYIDPLATVGTNFTGNLTGQLSGQQQRTFNLTFSLFFNRLTPNPEAACSLESHKAGLRGELGIKEIIGTGLRYATGLDEENRYPYLMPAIGIGKVQVPADPLNPAAPTFGSTIEFTLTYGLGGGPNWTLTHFTGPSASLLNFTRMSDDTLVVAFSKVPPAPPGPAPPAGGSLGSRDVEIAGAAQAAQASVNRMILQRLSPR